jgi:hypothetical protein
MSRQEGARLGKSDGYAWGSPPASRHPKSRQILGKLPCSANPREAARTVFQPNRRINRAEIETGALLGQYTDLINDGSNRLRRTVPAAIPSGTPEVPGALNPARARAHSKKGPAPAGPILPTTELLPRCAKLTRLHPIMTLFPPLIAWPRAARDHWGSLHRRAQVTTSRCHAAEAAPRLPCGNRPG